MILVVEFFGFQLVQELVAVLARLLGLHDVP